MVHTNVLVFLEKCVNSSIKHFFYSFLFTNKKSTHSYWNIDDYHSCTKTFFWAKKLRQSRTSHIVPAVCFKSKENAINILILKTDLPESRERKSLWLRRLSQNVQPHFGIFFYSPLWYRSLLDRNASWNSKQRETQRYSPAGYEKSECAACWCCLLMPQFPFVLRHH